MSIGKQQTVWMFGSLLFIISKKSYVVHLAFKTRLLFDEVGGSAWTLVSLFKVL